MARKFDRLQIPKPCPADWEQMVGDERKRFCAECNKSVYNLSQMTGRQVEALLAASRGNLCARFTRTPDGGILTLPDEPPPGLQLISRRASPVATAVVTAIIGLGGNAAAQAIHTPKNPTAHSAEEQAKKDARPEAHNGPGWLIGIVIDQNGAVIAGATVTLISESTGEVQTAISSRDGEYRFALKSGGSHTLKVAAKGFQLAKINGLVLRATAEKYFHVTMKPEVNLLGGAMGIPPEPLRELVRDYSLIVIGQVGESVKTATEDDVSSIKTTVTISATLKGKAKKQVINVHREVYRIDVREIFSEPGNNLLLFLNDRSAGDGKKAGDSYEIGWGGSNVKQLPGTDLSVYQQRVEELIALLSSETSTAHDTVEWLVRCAEEPATRWEGAYELAQSAEYFKYALEDAERNKAAAEQIGTQDPNTNSIDTGYGQELRNSVVRLLTKEQKERLMKALFSTDQAGNGDVELIKIVSRFQDERFAPFLLSRLRRVEDDPPHYAQELIRLLADALRDDRVSNLAEAYSENVSYEDHEAADAEVEEPEEEAEAEADEEAEGEPEAETEVAEESEVESEAEKLTPGEARRRRSAMLKRFLDVAESKIKRTKAQKQ